MADGEEHKGELSWVAVGYVLKISGRFHPSYVWGVLVKGSERPILPILMLYKGKKLWKSSRTEAPRSSSYLNWESNHAPNVNNYTIRVQRF